MSGLAHLARLQAIMAALRGQNGCPWDAEQSPRSIVNYLLEEAHEVVRAVEQGDPDEIRDELGDLLFEIVFMTQFFVEEGRFDLDAVARGAAEKMIRRHPHVFGAGSAETAAKVVTQWQVIKDREKQDRDKPEGLLDSVPESLPALARAHRLSARAAQVGFDWDGPEAVWEKVREELAEAEAALPKGDRERLLGELGDLLFTLVNLIRHLGANAEAVMRRANRKFVDRFSAVERELAGQGLSPAEAGAERLNRVWDQVKSSPPDPDQGE